jgi:hypothetical protein
MGINNEWQLKHRAAAVEWRQVVVHTLAAQLKAVAAPGIDNWLRSHSTC